MKCLNAFARNSTEEGESVGGKYIATADVGKNHNIEIYI